jgi:hypothetical protein
VARRRGQTIRSALESIITEAATHG